MERDEESLPNQVTKPTKSKKQLKLEARARLARESMAKTPKEAKFKPLAQELPKEPENPAWTTDLQKEHVYEVYDRIAEGFSISRAYIWAPIKTFFDELALKPNQLVLDAGCGNGKHLKAYSSEQFVIGLDICKNLLTLGRACEKSSGTLKGQYIQGSVSHLPFRVNIFDAIICSAVLVHFPFHSQRVHVLKELGRCLKPGGKLLVTVWAKDGNSTTKLSDVFVPFSLENVPSSKSQHLANPPSLSPTPALSPPLPSPSDDQEQQQENLILNPPSSPEPSKAHPSSANKQQSHHHMDLPPNNNNPQNNNNEEGRSEGGTDRYYHMFGLDEVCELIREGLGGWGGIHTVGMDKDNYVCVFTKP